MKVLIVLILLVMLSPVNSKADSISVIPVNAYPEASSYVPYGITSFLSVAVINQSDSALKQGWEIKLTGVNEGDTTSQFTAVLNQDIPSGDTVRFGSGGGEILYELNSYVDDTQDQKEWCFNVVIDEDDFAASNHYCHSLNYYERYFDIAASDIPSISENDTFLPGDEIPVTLEFTNLSDTLIPREQGIPFKIEALAFEQLYTLFNPELEDSAVMTIEDMSNLVIMEDAPSGEYKICFSHQWPLDDNPDNDILCKNFVIDEVSSIADEHKLENYNVYPNPAVSHVEFEVEHAQPDIVNIYDIQGNEIVSKDFDGKDQLRIDLPDVTPGTYIYEIIADDKLNRGKLIVE